MFWTLGCASVIRLAEADGICSIKYLEGTRLWKAALVAAEDLSKLRKGFCSFVKKKFFFVMCVCQIIGATV